MNCKDCKNKVSSDGLLWYCQILWSDLLDDTTDNYCYRCLGKSHFEPKNDCNPFKGLKLNK